MGIVAVCYETVGSCDIIFDDGSESSVPVELVFHPESTQLKEVHLLEEDEKLEWAALRKSQGNELFRKGEHIYAKEKYREAIQCLDSIEVDSSCQHTALFVVGSPIKVDCKKRGFCEGIVSFVNDDGTFDVIFDDDSEEDSVPRSRICALLATSDSEKAAMALKFACHLNLAR